MKKNTMITVEEELVKKAKALGINISEITSKAIKVEMELMMTGWLIPKVKSLKLRNIGPFKEADLGFTNGINIIYGPNATGKSTIIRSLTRAFKHESEQELPTVRQGEGNGRIEVELFPAKIVKVLSSKQKKSKIAEKELKDEMVWMRIPEELRSYGEKRMLYLWSLFSHAKPHNAILFDEPTLPLADSCTSWFINSIKKSPNQIIIATLDKRLLKIPNANIYETYLENGVAKVRPYKKEKRKRITNVKRSGSENE